MLIGFSFAICFSLIASFAYIDQSIKLSLITNADHARDELCDIRFLYQEKYWIYAGKLVVPP